MKTSLRRFLGLALILAGLAAPMLRAQNNDILKNGDFSDYLRHWELEQLVGARASVEIDQDLERPNFTLARVTVPAPAKLPSHVQLVQRRLLLDEGRTYRVTFDARAKPALRAVANLKVDRSPWPNLWTQPIQLTPEWQTFSFTVKLKQGTDVGRLTFTGLGAQTGIYEFAQVSLVPLD